MLTAKSWRTEAVLRLGLSVFVCVQGGALALLGLQSAGSSKAGAGFYALLVAAFVCLGVTLFLLRKPWHIENVMPRMLILMGTFFAGALCGALAERLAGPIGHSVSEVIVSGVSFQGAMLGLAGLFLREHQTSWSDGFGIGRGWPRAVLFGAMLACLFLPVGNALQWLSAEAMLHVPGVHLKPEEQQVVKTLQLATNRWQWVVLGVVTLGLAPVAEEVLFRGILYTWIKQWGFPEAALWGTALLFGAIHSNLVTFLPLTFFALVLALLYERTGNLLAPITAHALFNAANFARLYYIQRSAG